MPVGDVSTSTHVVLYSGGPDSFITHHSVKKAFGETDNVIPLYYCIPHVYGMQERMVVKRTLPHTVVLNDLSFLEEWEEQDSHIYARNVFLILAASRLYPNAKIYLSVQKDELEIPDRKPITLAAVNSLLSMLDVSAKVTSLWFDKDKTDMVKHFVSTGGDLSKLYQTWSCYRPRFSPKNRQLLIHCGDCPACIRRHIAFHLGIGEDKTPYFEDPKTSDMAKEYVIKAETGVYSSDRNARILEALCTPKT